MADTPRANEPGYWRREVAQVARDTAARMIRLADELEAEAEQLTQQRLVDELVPDGTYGGARRA
jgi:ATP-dependent protease HslVU (ClpYQ) ATPase subunit